MKARSDAGTSMSPIYGINWKPMKNILEDLGKYFLFNSDGNLSSINFRFLAKIFYSLAWQIRKQTMGSTLNKRDSKYFLEYKIKITFNQVCNILFLDEQFGLLNL